MRGDHRRGSRTLLSAAAFALCLGATVGAAPAQAGNSTDPVRALSRAAQTLGSTQPGGSDNDLRAFDRMIGNASVVGVGEATHGSNEFRAFKDRLFRHLVERQGFTTFAFETSWSTGLRLNDWVQTGRGDLSKIMDEEFQHANVIWNTEETKTQFRWMREWNRTHPNRPVQVVGDDVGYAGPELFDTVTAYVARWYPDLLPEVQRLYRESRPTGTAGEAMGSWEKIPLADRERMRGDVQRVLRLLEQRPAGADPRQHALILQHARSIAQVGTLWGFDFTKDVPAMMRYRDQQMAANTLWWHDRTGSRILLSAHNGHVAEITSSPESYPKLQGEFLADRLGKRYVSVGFTFGQGDFNAWEAGDPAKALRSVTLGPGTSAGNEHTLEQVSGRDYYLDTRDAPAAARTWLNNARPTRSLGAEWPIPEYETVNLKKSYDVLVHLHRVTATHLG
ncbi:erythromycin esterase family protein [Streptomyces sp. SID3343]|uniref:erythromycin esterase family protein n=1 Tax=Streptomyces sp. SID3343 TaxID=2690260 RepID=UPI001F19509E|nr:erythromycin esterase family protein [Streptomyces sp. SID3343]